MTEPEARSKFCDGNSSLTEEAESSFAELAESVDRWC